MIIKEMYSPFKLTQTIAHTFLGRDGREMEETEEVLVEHMINVYINQKLTMKLVCIPEYLGELILGRLLTEGMIKNSDEIASLTIDGAGTRADVILSDVSVYDNMMSESASSRQSASDQASELSASDQASEQPSSDQASELSAPDFVEVTPSACTSNHILNDYFIKYSDKQKVTPIPWRKEWIFALADKFAAGMPIHSRTWSTHSAFLAMDEKILFECEDIGRHNAMDKAIGYAVRNNIDLGKCILYSSGRIPTDMVMKAIQAGVPILASKASLTKDAAELAKAYNLTLVCAARRDRMKLYAGSMPVE